MCVVKTFYRYNYSHCAFINRIVNGKATGEEATDTTMTDAEVSAFKKEWDRNWRPGFNTAIITRPFDVLIPVFNETLFS